MPIFKKSNSDNGRLNESHRKVLQRCRFRLIKDIDAQVILDQLSSDDGFKHDIKEQILSYSTREQKNGAFLDRLETRGDRTFLLFLEILQEKYKHLAFILEEYLRTIDSGGEHEIMHHVTGESIRRLLVKNQAKKMEHSQCSESVDDLDSISYEREANDYIECYTIPMRGKLQLEPWIKEGVAPLEDVQPLDAEFNNGDKNNMYMGKIMKKMLFKEVCAKDIPKTVKLPPAYCKVYVFEESSLINEYRAQDSFFSKFDDDKHLSAHRQSLKSASNKLHNHRHAKDPLPPKPKRSQPPPLVPPKSVLYPRDSATMDSAVENGLKSPQFPDISPSTLTPSTSCTSKDLESPSFPLDFPTSPSIPENTLKEAPATDLVNAPPIPPRIGSKSRTSISKPPAPEKIEENGIEMDSSTECDETLMSKQIPAPDETEEDSSQTITNSSFVNPDEEYEAICTADDPSINNRPNSTDNAENNIIKRVASEVDSMKAGSGSLTPASLGRLSTSDSESEMAALSSSKVQSKPPSSLPLGPKPWSDVPIFANDAGSSDADYEDIDALDRARSPSIKGSNAYLHPRSSGRFSERKPYSWKSGMADHYVELQIGDLVVVDHEDVVNTESVQQFQTPAQQLQTPAQQSSDGSPVLSPMQTDKEDSVEKDNTFSRPSVARTVAALEASAVGTSQQTPVTLSPQHSKIEKTDKATQYLNQSVDLLHLYRNTQLCYDKIGRAFYVNKDKVKHFGDPDGETWFYPVPVTSQQASLFLRMEDKKGCFLVYKTTRAPSKSPYNLSVCRGNNEVIHYHILQNSHGDLMIEGHDHSFMSIHELVTYFQCNKSQLATRLSRPLKEVSMPITPGYHYEMAYELRRRDITLSSNIIGKGNFGVVCSGVYQGNVAVAVKVLQKGDRHSASEDEFVEEAKMLMKLNHEHIVRLIGVSCSTRPFFLVTEYVQSGSLRKCLQTAIVPNDHIDILFDICLQITSAMCYLESRRYMLHRDLAARNLLVTADMCIKLADFGRARFVMDDNYQAEKDETVPIKWAAPEVLIHSTYSTKSDVWALGTLYWEILSGGELPFSELTGEQVAIYVIEGGRLEKPPGCSSDLFKVMKLCWKESAASRPSCASLYDMLQSKSSIYYSSESCRRSKKDADLGAIKRNIKTPSQAKKARHKSDTMSTKLTRRSTMMEHSTPKVVSEGESVSKSRERIPTSSSETSLASTALFERDDLTRGDKIRKSLRKIMTIKKGKSANNKLSGHASTPESGYQDNY